MGLLQNVYSNLFTAKKNEKPERKTIEVPEDENNALIQELSKKLSELYSIIGSFTVTNVDLLNECLAEISEFIETLGRFKNRKLTQKQKIDLKKYMTQISRKGSSIIRKMQGFTSWEISLPRSGIVMRGEQTLNEEKLKTLSAKWEEIKLFIRKSLESIN